MIAIIQVVITLIILGILYKQMIKWELPLTISKQQTIVPVVLGMVSLLITIGFAWLNGTAAKSLGYVHEAQSPAVKSFVAAFLNAGLPEETAKLLMMLAAIRIFRKHINNVYEYILIGAGVGFGFTLVEEFIYGSSLISIVFRMIVITGHMMFGICMARHRQIKEERGEIHCV